MSIFSILGDQGHLIGAFLQILSAGKGVFDRVEAAMADGEITATEARDIGYAVADSLGDLVIKVNGRDILDIDATREILGGAARIVRRIVLAKRAG